MVQLDRRAADFVDQLLTTVLEFFQIGRTKLRVRRARKNQIGHFQIADRPIVRRGLRINLFPNSKGRFANFVVRPNIADDRWINRVSINHQRVIAGFRRVLPMRERSRNHDVRISHSDQEAVFL